MLLKYRRMRHQQEPVELNITAFLALMVILVPFLLLSLAFTRIVEIETPFSSGSNTPQETVVQPLRITLQDYKISISNFAGENQTIEAKTAGNVETTNSQVASNQVNANPENATPANTTSTATTVAGQSYDLAALSQALVELKQRFPEETQATVLFDADTSYENLLETIQTVSRVQTLNGNVLTVKPLFPKISQSMAPILVEEADGSAQGAEANDVTDPATTNPAATNSQTTTAPTPISNPADNSTGTSTTSTPPTSTPEVAQ